VSELNVRFAGVKTSGPFIAHTDSNVYNRDWVEAHQWLVEVEMTPVLNKLQGLDGTSPRCTRKATRIIQQNYNLMPQYYCNLYDLTSFVDQSRRHEYPQVL
jgi:hypothetical protein